MPSANQGFLDHITYEIGVVYGMDPKYTTTRRPEQVVADTSRRIQTGLKLKELLQQLDRRESLVFTVGKRTVEALSYRSNGRCYNAYSSRSRELEPGTILPIEEVSTGNDPLNGSDYVRVGRPGLMVDLDVLSTSLKEGSTLAIDSPES